MEEKEVKDLLEKEVLKLKVLSQEKTIRFLLGAFGLFGVIVLLLWSAYSSDKISKAIGRMDDRELETRKDLDSQKVQAKKEISQYYEGPKQNQKLLSDQVRVETKAAVTETQKRVDELLNKQLAKPEIVLLYNG